MFGKSNNNQQSDMPEETDMQQIQRSLIRIDAHVGEISKRMDQHDERISKAEREIIEERGRQQGMERAMAAEHSLIHNKIEALGERLTSVMEGISSTLRAHTERENRDREQVAADRRVMMRLLWSTLIGIVVSAITFLMMQQAG